MQRTMIASYSKRNRFSTYVGVVDTEHGELEFKFHEEYYGHNDPDNNVDIEYRLNGEMLDYNKLQDYFNEDAIWKLQHKAWHTKVRT